MFTNEQIEVIEDRVINKIIYPLVTLNKMYYEGIITDKQLKVGINNLTDLYNWVYSLRR